MLGTSAAVAQDSGDPDGFVRHSCGYIAAVGDIKRSEELLLYHLRSRHGLVRRGDGLSVRGGNIIYGNALGPVGLATLHEDIHRRGYLDGTVDHELRNLSLAL
jgi:hypothetical protein